MKANVASIAVPNAAIENHLSDSQPLVAVVTIPRPSGLSNAREFDVLVNAPAGVTQVSADSPYYAGTVAFFGSMMPGMKMSEDATFTVPLRKNLQAFTALRATGSTTALNIRLVPSQEKNGPAPTLKAVSVGTP